MKNLKKLISLAVPVILLLAGLGLLVYPRFSEWWNERISSRAVAAYTEAAAVQADFESIWEAAREYNAALNKIGSAQAIYSPESVGRDYEGTLDITGTGIMGYITIEKIGVELPVYHGTDDAVLRIAAGHLEGSSLPTGDEGTHVVLTGHSGLPSAKLFTDLDQLQIGDTFTLTVLDRTFTYEIDQIKIVLPSEITDLYIEEGIAYCTLITCTPYGVNSHRLLVRGSKMMDQDSGLK
ncbi:MAG: class C sortase [Lachnospiraceae bacterium]|nr:class C sortase [Lachnospiraceae bacterium]